MSISSSLSELRKRHQAFRKSSTKKQRRPAATT